MLNDTFYEELPEIPGFDAILTPENYADAPRNWVIVVADVLRSTEAVAAGKYKQVNIAGASAVAVISNIVGHLRFPFTFGGDGMTAVLPPDTAETALDALRDLQSTIRRAFEIELRVGAITVGEVRAGRHEVRIGKLRVSEKYTQAVFDGAGIARAEELVKADTVPTATPHSAEPAGNAATRASTEGFSCRWRAIPSDPGETVSLIVEAVSNEPRERAAVSHEVLAAIRNSLGDEKQYHPVARGPQQAVEHLAEIDNEARLHARGRGGLALARQRAWVWMQLIAVKVALRWNLPLRYHYKTLNEIPRDNINHADFRKYDGRLKMVLACDSNGRQALERKLNELEHAGKIAYGAHISDHALITCIMHLRAPDEVHFIDGGDGGYTLAAAELKRKLGRQSINETSVE